MNLTIAAGRVVIAVTFVVSLCCATLTAAANKDAPYVAGFESHFRVQRSAENNVKGGELLLEELNCLSCHRNESGDAGLLTRQAPDLQDVAYRADPAFIQKYLRNPAAHQPRSTMPAMLSHLTDKQQAESAAALTHYLVSLRRRPFHIAPPDQAAVQRGEQLYHEVGCVACHLPEQENVDIALPTSSRLFPRMDHKYSLDGLRQFLRDPHGARPSGRMPNMLLTDREASDISEFLLRRTQVAAPLNYRLFHGRRSSLDDDKQLELFRTGIASGFDLKIPHRNSDFSVRLEGYLQIAVAGKYTFFLSADDGGRLLIDRELLIDNNSTRNTGKILSGQKTTLMDAGLHEISVEYFQRRDDAVLNLNWQPPDSDRQPIPRELLRNAKNVTPHRHPWPLNQELVSTGRQLFATLGCNDCHRVQKDAPARLSPSFADIALSNHDTGCLSESQGDYPHFSLDGIQRSAMQSALRQLRESGPTPSTPLQRVEQTMTRFQCYACHQRDKFGGDGGTGGVADNRQEYFVTDVIELGDEGRLPPALTGVGDKLQRTWLQAVLYQRGTARPYMKTRMPQFGEQHVSHLTDDFIRLDRQSSDPGEFTGAADAARKAGLTLVDKGRLQCIACHDFNRHKSIGIRATDLVTMPQRLNRDWFHRYLLNPGRFRPGTKMPSSWPNGRSLFSDVLNGDAAQQISAIWIYLSDGRKAIPPSGLSRQSMELIVGGEAIVYRNKIREAGFRGICVGHPEEVNLSFDAETMRLTQIWKGRFLNAAPHWSVQGMGRIGPIGHDIITFPTGTPLARFDSLQTPWPEESGQAAEYQFRGYQLDEMRRPAFEYTFHGAAVTDFCEGAESPQSAAADTKILRRTLTISKRADQSRRWLRLWRGDEVVPEAAGQYLCDDRLTIKVRNDVEAVVREISGQTELLLDVSSQDKFVVEYIW